MTQEEMLSQMEMMLQPLQQVNASQTEQNESLQSRIKELTAQIAWLNRQLFGRKSEKLPIIDPNYPDLFAGMLPENAQQIADAHDEAVEKIVKTKEERRQEKKNRIMMEDLPVLEQVILTPDDVTTRQSLKVHSHLCSRCSVISTKRSAWSDIRGPSTGLGMTRRGSG